MIPVGELCCSTCFGDLGTRSFCGVEGNADGAALASSLGICSVAGRCGLADEKSASILSRSSFGISRVIASALRSSGPHRLRSIGGGKSATEMGVQNGWCAAEIVVVSSRVCQGII